jgi:glucosamine--fructose-6-phosphate aminotransferase (isomerizing)
MCGIIGVIGKNAFTSVMRGLQYLEYRGYDSMGVAVIASFRKDNAATANNVYCHAKTHGSYDNLQNLLTQISDGDLHCNVLQSDLLSSKYSANLDIALFENAQLCFGHTRWATHGGVSEKNAHPHVGLLQGDITIDNDIILAHNQVVRIDAPCVSVIHNGIVSNYKELRSELINDGYLFTSETDTEVITHFLSRAMSQHDNYMLAMKTAISRLNGNFVFVAIMLNHPDKLFVVKCGDAPVVLGIGDCDVCVSSDVASGSHVCDKFCYLESMEFAILQQDIINTNSDNTPINQKVEIYDKHGTIVSREFTKLSINYDNATKGSYDHFMLKEINEQPQILQNIISDYIDSCNYDFGINMDKIQAVKIIACGSSYYAGMVGGYFLQDLCKIDANAAYASEFRIEGLSDLSKSFDNTIGGSSADEIEMQNHRINHGINYHHIFISQSGETFDTVAAHNYAKSCKYHTTAIVNAGMSTLSRVADNVLYTLAGREISVASTKTFTAQLMVLLILAIEIAHRSAKAKIYNIVNNSLANIPLCVSAALSMASEIESVSNEIAQYKHCLFLSRSILYPIALEAALKMKELAYIHAEAVMVGELKHGVLSLIDRNMPVVIFAPSTLEPFSAICSCVEELTARGAILYIFTDIVGAEILGVKENIRIVVMNSCSSIESPFVYAIIAQKLAYYSAKKLSREIDKPRHLAKSVTVE